MRHELLVCVAMSGCGFRSSAGPGDGATLDAADPIDAARSDAAGDAAADAARDAPTLPASTCYQHWLAHDVALEAPVELTPLSTSSIERDPWLSKDGRSLYFAREPGTKGMSDIYLATRAVATDDFATADEVTNLNTVVQESRAALTEDELTLMLASNRSGNHFAIHVTTRTNRGAGFGSPDQARLSKVNGPGNSTQHYDPFLTADGSQLYLAPDPSGSEPQHIWVATFDRVNDEYTAPVKLRVINATDPGADSDPALSLDERVIVFSSNRAGGAGGDDLYYATRAAPGQDFSPPVLIPTVNGDGSDGDPMLSADGCELYFASTRNGGDYDLFLARVTP